MAAEPTGDEPWTPLKITETSVTERAVFRKCRRQWFLHVGHRLRPPGGNENFWLGELIHAALQAYYEHDEARHGCRRERCHVAASDALHVFDITAGVQLDDVEQELGFLWPHAEEHWRGLAAMARQVVEGYFRFDQESGGLGDVIAVEQRFRVRIPGTRGKLTLRVDLVVIDRAGRRVVVDHKSASSKPSEAMHDIDDQFTGYFWGYQEATGEAVARVTRNVLLKRPPVPPKLIKGGRALSQDRRAPTTYELYLGAIREHGFQRADYADHLEYLAQKGWGDFYVRQTTIRTRGQLAEFARVLGEEWRDMRQVALHPERAYPNPSPMHCPSCPVRDLCATMMDRGDVAGQIRQGYVVGDERE